MEAGIDVLKKLIDLYPYLDELSKQLKKTKSSIGEDNIIKIDPETSKEIAAIVVKEIEAILANGISLGITEEKGSMFKDKVIEKKVTVRSKDQN